MPPKPPSESVVQLLSSKARPATLRRMSKDCSTRRPPPRFLPSLARHMRPRSARSRWRSTPRAVSEGRSEKDEQFRRVVSGRVEEAGKMLDDMIDDIVCDLSTVQSMGYLYEELPTETESQIIKKVVRRFLDRLDQNFLASLTSFEQRSTDMGHPDVARLINKIKSEVVDQINQQFPAEVLLLEELMTIPDKKDRIAVIKQAAEQPPPVTSPPDDPPPQQDIYLDVREDSLEGMDLKQELERLQVLKTEGLKSLREELEKSAVISEDEDVADIMASVEDPLEDCEAEEQEPKGLGIDPLRLGMAANQFIVDMEEKEEIPNRQLLAKLCVIREEVRLVELEMRFSGALMEDNPLKLRENVPSQVMGVIQILIKSKDPIKRIGVLREAFEKDKYAPSSKDLSKAPGYVRPGIFMTSLTMAQMNADERSKEKRSYNEITPLLLQRFEDIRLEAMMVLREIGWGAYTVDELAQQQRDRQEREKAIKEEFLSKE